ncbi:hypothetical protein Goshw_016838 [Gossypium schwendimanii]|uniref:DUF4283 domain-containing protein n=1 Tax=Gossypium schwendimanii TaxID=34291 RepID=A0A7J9LP81_GOSSC|nr:hypothetical protein [Gossypium schwendimanii]
MEAPPDTDGLIVDVNGQKAKDDGHVVSELVEGISLITISDRVHQLIERKMARTTTIKLLGRKIGFNSLLNKVTSLWSPKSHMQLMDLENYYYLVRFQDKGDFNKSFVPKICSSNGVFSSFTALVDNLPSNTSCLVHLFTTILFLLAQTAYNYTTCIELPHVAELTPLTDSHICILSSIGVFNRLALKLAALTSC